MATLIDGKKEHKEMLTDLISNGESGPFMSIEFFPPKTTTGVDTLYKVLEKLKVYNPRFADVTWGAGGSTSDLTLELCKGIKERGVTPNLHLTCTNMEVATIDAALKGCEEAGIVNILALRGDPPVGDEKWTAADATLTCALDLVRYIRKSYSKEQVCVTVAGYPEGHPNAMTVVAEGLDSLTASERGRCSIDVDEQGTETIICCRDEDFAKELDYLKQKIDAGADCIITQMIFDPECFRTFVDACRAVGILVPIIPGIMCISNYAGFKKMTKFCKSRVPQSMLDALDAANIAADDSKEALDAAVAAVKQCGIELVDNLCRKLVDIGSPGLHFYTLNTSANTMAVCDRLIRDEILPVKLSTPP